MFRRILAIIGFLMLLVLSSVLGTSCGTQAPTPTLTPTPKAILSPTAVGVLTPTPVRTAEPTPKAGWSPDGVISPKEYAKTKAYGNFEISWSNDERFIYVGMKAKTSGWVSVAIPESKMTNSDMILGFVKNGETTVYDLYGSHFDVPHSLDTKLGGTSDIVAFGGKEEGGYTTIEFQRALNTGDQYDKPLASGKNGIAWAYGTDDDWLSDHSKSNRGYGELDL